MLSCYERGDVDHEISPFVSLQIPLIRNCGCQFCMFAHSICYNPLLISDHITYHHTSTISRAPPFITVIIPYHFTPTHHYTHPYTHLRMTLSKGDLYLQLYAIAAICPSSVLLSTILVNLVQTHVESNWNRVNKKFKRMKGVQETYNMMNTGGRLLTYISLFSVSTPSFVNIVVLSKHLPCIFNRCMVQCMFVLFVPASFRRIVMKSC